MSGIATEPLAWRDGVPFSERYGDVYASRDGALGQARHVFLGGNQLPARWPTRPMRWRAALRCAAPTWPTCRDSRARTRCSAWPRAD